MKCTKYQQEKNDNDFYIRKDSKKGFSSQCKKCHVQYMTQNHQKSRLLLVERFGGKCMRCGFNEEPLVLQFHHRDPSQKEFKISETVRLNIDEKLLNECNKCDLLCPNCHAIHHLKYGMVSPEGVEPSPR